MKSFLRITILLLSTIAITASAFASGSLIDPTVDAKTKIITMRSNDIPLTVQVVGNIVAEEISLERLVSGSDTLGTWEPLELEGSVVLGLTEANHAITFYGPMKVRINKPVTVNPVGVVLLK